MKYKVQILPKVMKILGKFDKALAYRMMQKIDSLEVDPRQNGSIKLSGRENSYRTRVGSYRILYEIYDKKVLVVVIDVDHRKDVYKS